jgi:hypothetical protein
MEKEEKDPLPKNSTEAQGLLIKALYGKFGDEILPIVEEVLGIQGRALGLKIKNKMPDDNLSTAARTFVQNFEPADVKIIELTDEHFHIQGTKCPFGLENTSRKLCEAVMAIDREYFTAAVRGTTTLQIIKTRAAGDPVCDTLYTLI